MNFKINKDDIESVKNCPCCDADSFIGLALSIVDNVEFLYTSCCKECGLVFREKRPKLRWFLNNFKLRDSFQVNEKINFINKNIENDRISRYRSIAFFLKKVTDGRKILDVGCGTGTGLKSFEDQGFEVTGIEPDHSRAKIGRQLYNVNIVETTIDDYKIESEKFYVVTCIHSLEHFHNPLIVMKSISNLAKEGGYVYIEVPDFVDFVKDWNDAIFLAHISNFSENNLSLLGASVGLRPLIRSYPKSSGYVHLGILFHKDSSYRYNKSHYVQEHTVNNTLKYAISCYKNNIDTTLLKNEIPTFSLPFINDISLSYKIYNKNQSTESNYNQYIYRSAIYNPDCESYVIGVSSKVKEKTMGNQTLKDKTSEVIKYKYL